MLIARLKDYSLHRYKKMIMPFLILAALIWGSSLACGVNLSVLMEGIVKGVEFLGYLFPPDWSAFPEMILPTFQSIVLALLGTLFGTFFSLFFGLAAASNISHKWLRNASRFVIGAERSLPEIIILLVLIAALGLGPFPGVIALSLGCIGMLGKLFADAIEEIDTVTIESIEAVGANKLQVIVFCIIPQIVPTVIANAIFRFEINIRLSVLLGAVGAGGIGYELYHSFAVLEYQRACSALIVILTMVFITERLSDYLRRRIKREEILK